MWRNCFCVANSSLVAKNCLNFVNFRVCLVTPAAARLGVRESPRRKVRRDKCFPLKWFSWPTSHQFTTHEFEYALRFILAHFSIFLPTSTPFVGVCFVDKPVFHSSISCCILCSSFVAHSFNSSFANRQSDSMQVRNIGSFVRTDSLWLKICCDVH